MIRVCAWCEAEGRPAVMGEKEPLEDKSLTHGICPRHEKPWFKKFVPHARPPRRVGPDLSKWSVSPAPANGWVPAG